MQERLDAELVAAGAPDPPGQLERARPDARPGRLVERGELEQLGDAGRLVGPVRLTDSDPARVARSNTSASVVPIVSTRASARARS